MITLKNIGFHYQEDDFRLNIPLLQIENGSRTAVVGPSGSGKTTFLRLIAGIITPTQGEIQINGTAISQMDDSSRRNFRISKIGFVFQEFELIEYLSVYENILLPYFINSSMKLDAIARRKAAALAESMNLGSKLKQNIVHISQGEKQRVAICRALLINPQLIIADEPTGNLDPINKKCIVEILFDRSIKTGATLLMVTHDHSLLDGFDQVIDFEQLCTTDKS